jgi:hypothetical protein
VTRSSCEVGGDESFPYAVSIEEKSRLSRLLVQSPTGPYGRCVQTYARRRLRLPRRTSVQFLLLGYQSGPIAQPG